MPYLMAKIGAKDVEFRDKITNPRRRNWRRNKSRRETRRREEDYEIMRGGFNSNGFWKKESF